MKLVFDNQVGFGEAIADEKSASGLISLSPTLAPPSSLPQIFLPRRLSLNLVSLKRWN